MSEEIKKTQPEPVEQPVELAEQELDKVAGGRQKAFLAGHSFPTLPAKTPATNPL